MPLYNVLRIIKVRELDTKRLQQQDLSPKVASMDYEKL